MNPIRKSLQLHAADAMVEGDGPGKLSANVSMVGIPDDDSYPDIIFPGAFDNTFERFMAEGFIALNHQWDEEPIAYPTLIEARGKAIYSEATYHSTDCAQEARTIAQERLAAGKAVGVSVGFYIASEGSVWFENGEKLLKFAQDNGYDMKLFDRKAVGAVKGWCRGILKVARLAEWSQVNIPANPQAWATDAKSAPVDASLCLQSIDGSREAKAASLEAWKAAQHPHDDTQARERDARIRSLRSFALGQRA